MGKDLQQAVIMIKKRLQKAKNDYKRKSRTALQGQSV